MSFNARTDLALEAREMYYESSALETEIPGIEVDNEKVSKGINVTRVRILSEEGERALHKERGNYITLEIPDINHGEQKEYEETCRAVAKELQNIIKLEENDVVLVVGLGNWNITADALGPKVVESLMVTRHLLEYMPEEIDEGVRPVCALAPGVLGLTGIETGEVIKGVVERVKPKLVIAIDSLCSRKMERVSTTIQIADTGITPGAGVGNRRKGLNQQFLGVPVIAIGVPMVVDAATIAGDSIEMLIGHLKNQANQNDLFYQLLSNIDQSDKYGLIKEAITPSIGNFIVTPKEVDSVIDDISSVVANGINIALHEGIGFDDIDRYV